MANSEMELFNDSDFITLPQGENKGDVMVRPSVSYWRMYGAGSAATG